jgi:hypothetical protein
VARDAAAAGTDRLVLLGRPECGLCTEMLVELQRLGRTTPLPPIDIVDVDGDRELARRYGLKIPVLLLGDTPVCEHRLDAAELLRLLRHIRL